MSNDDRPITNEAVVAMAQHLVHEHGWTRSAAADAFGLSLSVVERYTPADSGSRHTCTPGVIGSAYDCPGCGLGPPSPNASEGSVVTDSDLLTEARRLLATDPEFAATVEAAAALASRQHHSLTTPVLDQARLTAALALVAVKAGVS